MKFYINQLFVDGFQGNSKTKFYDKKKKKNQIMVFNYTQYHGMQH